MSIVSVDDLVSRPITVMNTIQEAVHVETRLEYSHVLRYAICFNDILIFIAMNFRSRRYEYHESCVCVRLISRRCHRFGGMREERENEGGIRDNRIMAGCGMKCFDGSGICSI